MSLQATDRVILLEIEKDAEGKSAPSPSVSALRDPSLAISKVPVRPTASPQDWARVMTRPLIA